MLYDVVLVTVDAIGLKPNRFFPAVTKEMLLNAPIHTLSKKGHLYVYTKNIDCFSQAIALCQSWGYTPVGCVYLDSGLLIQGLKGFTQQKAFSPKPLILKGSQWGLDRTLYPGEVLSTVSNTHPLERKLLIFGDSLGFDSCYSFDSLTSLVQLFPTSDGRTIDEKISEGLGEITKIRKEIDRLSLELGKMVFDLVESGVKVNDIYKVMGVGLARYFWSYRTSQEIENPPEGFNELLKEHTYRATKRAYEGKLDHGGPNSP